MTVSAPLRRLKGAPALQPAALSSATLVIAGAVLGPRNCGYSRSTTVTSGQSEPQLNSHIGRDEAEGPYMACKRSGDSLAEGALVS
jgi:hypothetical protein